MRRIFWQIAIVMALTSCVLAQDTNSIPKLNVWMTVQGIRYASLLHDFDNEHGGQIALAVDRGCGETWYMRNASDFQSHFCWGRGIWVAQADLDGTGHGCFIDDSLCIYNRNSLNELPSKIQSARYPSFQIPPHILGSRFFVGDFNQDGKEDVVVIGYQSNAKILLGGADLRQLKVLEFPQADDLSIREQQLVSIFIDVDHKCKVILYGREPSSYIPRSDGFYMFEVSFPGDSVIQYKDLNSWVMKIEKSTDPIYDYDGSFVWANNSGSDRTLVAGGYALKEAYKIVNNKFVLKSASKKKESGAFIINSGIIDKSKVGYARAYFPIAYLYEGDPAVDSTTKAWIPFDFDRLIGVGDVNNDGHGDIAVTSDEGLLHVYLGQETASGVVSDSISQISIEFAGEHPLKTSQSLTVSIAVQESQNCRVEIFDLEGRLAGQCFNGELNAGTNSVTMRLNSLVSTAGIYNLRFHIGRRTIDKGIIITN